jgi:hypothetical protein
MSCAIFLGLSLLVLKLGWPIVPLTFALTISRACASGAFSIPFTYSQEVYPTLLRSCGASVANTMVRLGAVVSPFIGVFLQIISQAATFATLAALAATGAIATTFLAIDTAGVSMVEHE